MVSEKVQEEYEFYQNTPSVIEEGINQWDGYYWYEVINEHDMDHIKISFEDWDQTFIDPPFLLCPQRFLDRFVGLYVQSADGDTRQCISPMGLSVYTSSTTTKDIDGPVILTEGVMDAELVGDYGLPSFGCLKSTPSYFLIGLLNAIADKLVFIPDNDGSGEDAKEIFAKKCVNFEQWVDFDIIDLTCCGDPGEIFTFGIDSREYNLLKQKIVSNLGV